MLKPKQIKHVIDNGDILMGPILVSVEPSLTKPIITDDSGIFQSGTDQAIDTVLNIIQGAKEVLCISSFMIQESDVITEIEKAIEKGVRVYMLTAPEQQVNSRYEDDNSDLSERNVALISLLKKLGHKMLIKTAEHLHSKFMLADPATNPRGAVFTNNLTKRAMSENLELTVKLEPDAVKELFHQFLTGFWLEAEREVWLEGSDSRLRTQNKHPEFINPEYSPEKLCWTMKESKLLSSILIKAIESAQRSISLSAWSFSMESTVTQEILKRARERISVRVFTRPSKGNVIFIREIINAGGQVFCHDLMHAKSILVDDNFGLIMTANFSPLGLDSGFETGVFLNNKQINVLDRIHKEWVSRALYHSEKSIQFRELRQSYLDLDTLMTKHNPPELEKKIMPPKDIYASSMLDYKNGFYRFQRSADRPTTIKEIHTFNLLAPKLPDRSKNIGKTDDKHFDLYELNGRKYLLVQNEEDIDLAIQLEQKHRFIAVTLPQTKSN